MAAIETQPKTFSPSSCPASQPASPPPPPCKGILKRHTAPSDNCSDRCSAEKERSQSCLDLAQMTSIFRSSERETSRTKRERPQSFPGAGTVDLIQLTSVEKKKKKRVRFPPSVLLQQAIVDGDQEEVEQLICEYGAGIANEREPTGLTSAMRCVFEDQLGALAILAGAGADFAACDEENWTVLHVASTMDNIEAAKFVLTQTKVCLTHARNEDGERAIDIAESAEMTRLLLEADLAHPDTKPTTTSERDELAILQHVQAHFDRNGTTADLNRVMQSSTKHDSLLHLAASRNYAKLATYLLSHGLCELERRDRRGATPLQTAALHNSGEVAGLLVRFGASVAALTARQEDSPPAEKKPVRERGFGVIEEEKVFEDHLI